MAGACVIGGIKWIEKVNMVLVPVLLGIIVITYTWSSLQLYGDYGIKFLFTPDLESLSNAKLWMESLTQNAFDTGAAMGLIVPYATYMSRKNGVVKYAALIPAVNNFVSLLCAITIFGTVFSTLIVRYPSLSRTGILEILKTTGPASTGLTFVWIPILFGELGVVGKILCILFFMCLSFAGLSSVIADFEHTSLTFCDFGLDRRLATPICGILMFLLGLPSALFIQALDNQDLLWGFALLPSGLMFQALVLKVGWNTFKEKLVNQYGIGDWPLTHASMAIILIVAPIEAVVLLIWWIYDEISGSDSKQPGERWYDFGLETLMTVFVTWTGLVILLMLCNLLVCKMRPKWMRSTRIGDIGEEIDEEAADDTAAYADPNDAELHGSKGTLELKTVNSGSDGDKPTNLSPRAGTPAVASPDGDCIERGGDGDVGAFANPGFEPDVPVVAAAQTVTTTADEESTAF